jgi:hypothetical protein
LQLTSSFLNIYHREDQLQSQWETLSLYWLWS